MRRMSSRTAQNQNAKISDGKVQSFRGKCECKSHTSKPCPSAFLIELFIINLFLESSQTRHSNFKFWKVYVSGFDDKRSSPSPDNCILRHENALSHTEVLAKRHLSNRQIPIFKIHRTRLKITTKGSHFEQFAGIHSNLSSLPQRLTENYF
jgi:ribosomal protein L39E